MTTPWRAREVKLTASHDPWITACYTDTRPEWTKPEERVGVLRWTAMPSPPRAARCEAAQAQGAKPSAVDRTLDIDYATGNVPTPAP